MICLLVEILIFVLLSSSISGNAFAEPEIHSVAGNFIDGKVIQIKGKNFGTVGPHVVMYEEFGGAKTVDDVIPLDSPRVGKWTAYGSARRPTYSEYYHSPPFSMKAIDKEGMRQLRLNFNPTTELFVSYWVKIPDGYVFPGEKEPEKLPYASSWKMAWLMNGEEGYRGRNDICLPTWMDGYHWGLTGNAGAFPTVHVGGRRNGQWFEFDKWIRVSVWLKGGKDPLVDKGTIYFQALVESGGMHEYTVNKFPLLKKTTRVFDDSPHWDRINFPGWLRIASDKTLAVYDDIYVATDDGAAARVEIGDAPEYSDCRNLALLIPRKWSNDSISAEVRMGSFTHGRRLFLYVFDSYGNHNAKGFAADN